MVHADDVADALTRAVTSGPGGTGGAFNLAAESPVTVHDIADVLDARHMQVPRRIVRTVVAATWRAHLQQLEPGWIDLAYSVPLLSIERANRQLGWAPAHDGPRCSPPSSTAWRGPATTKPPSFGLAPCSMVYGALRATVRWGTADGHSDGDDSAAVHTR